MPRQLFPLGHLFFLCQVGTLLTCHPFRAEVAANNNVESVIEKNVERLMELRRPGWGWKNTPEVIISIQLSKPQTFYGRNHSIAKLKEELKSESHNASMGKLGLYAMAIKSLCFDPHNFGGIDVLRKITNQMKKHWIHQGETYRLQPENNWYIYGLALQALCVNGVSIPRTQIERTLSGQETDGRFGFKYAVDNTAQMLLALKCVKAQRSMSNKRRLRSNVSEAINKAASFLSSKIVSEGDLTWIGNKYSTPTALMALRAAGQTPPPPTGDEILKSLFLQQNSDLEDSEAAVSQRLPALRRTSILSLVGIWSCLEQTDPFPEDYEPNYVSGASLGCPLFGSSLSFLESFFAVFIDVRLTVQTTNRNSTIIVQDVKKDNTLLEVMAQARCQGDFRFATTSSAYGPYITSINGLEADPALLQYWSILDAASNNPMGVGADEFLPSHDQHILFKLAKF